MRPQSLVAPVVAAIVVGATGLAFASGSGDSGGSGTAAAPGKPGTVAIKSFKYVPPSITVKAGTKVTFTNDDAASHTATSDTGGAFDTGGFDKGQSKVVSLKKAGTYAYHCDFHPFMHGTIVVK